MLLLIASVIGDAFGWEGQQDGRLVHDILPTRGHEDAQTGASSTVVLSPHTEDAFHPERAHLLALACLRNAGRPGYRHGLRTARRRRARPTARSSTRPLFRSCRTSSLRRRPRSGRRRAGRAGPVGTATTAWGSRYDPAYTPLDRADDTFRAAYRRLDEP